MELRHSVLKPVCLSLVYFGGKAVRGIDSVSVLILHYRLTRSVGRWLTLS